MKKLFLSLVAAIVASTATFAQSSMLATLSHNGTISTYYGASALKDAYNAAANGDVITLSSGTFTAVDIYKALTIRGAGMGLDSNTLAEPTIILGNFDINIADNVTKRLTIEGIYSNNEIRIFNLENATFLKSRFKIIRESGVKMKNVTFVHCRISELLRIYGDASVSCINSIIWYPQNGENDNTSNFEFNNCVVWRGPWAHQDLYRSTFKNSILLVTAAVAMDASNIFSYTLGVHTTGTTNLFSNASNNSNKQVKGFANVFKTFDSQYSDEETFELTDAASANYLGKDNTQVGVYGGNMPFDGTPTNPQITRCNVAAKTTADGKLSVDIEVMSAQ